MFTWKILIYLAALAAAAAFRVSYVGWFGVMLFWAVALLPPFFIILSLPSVLLAKCSFSAPDTTRRGSDTSAEFRLRPRTLLPLGGLRLKVNITNMYTSESREARIVIAGTGSSDNVFSLPSGSCGRVEITATSLWCRDLTGIITLPRRKPGIAFCTILPLERAPERIPDIEQALESDKNLTPKPGGGYAEEHELRDYRPGDPMRSMHWKLSSKMDKPIIREPLVNNDKLILVVLDPSGDIQRSLDTLCWLCGRLCALETPHTVIWCSGDGRHNFDINSPGNIAEMFEMLLSSPTLPPPAVDMTGVRRLFTVKNGEVLTS